MLGTCRAVGEIDIASAGAFLADLHDAVDRADEDLVGVDCSGVTFMDSAGFHTLVEATEYAARHAHTLVVRNLSSECQRLLMLSAQSGDLVIEPSPRPGGS